MTSLRPGLSSRTLDPHSEFRSHWGRPLPSWEVTTST